MFTIEERDNIRNEIIKTAQGDPRISGGAVTGSASAGQEDRWSDIDLAFGVHDESQLQTVLSNFTNFMYGKFHAVHHLDVLSGSWIYRVFLLENTLQVDLAFVGQSEFGARAPSFRLLFGTSNDLPKPTVKDNKEVVGWAWLHALHARSSIERNKLWQAEYFISGMRDYVFGLSCLRLGLPDRQGRGIDKLPAELKAKMEQGLVREMNAKELRRAFRAVSEVFFEEVDMIDEVFASNLIPTAKMLCEV